MGANLVVDTLQASVVITDHACSQFSVGWIAVLVLIAMDIILLLFITILDLRLTRLEHRG